MKRKLIFFPIEGWRRHSIEPDRLTKSRRRCQHRQRALPDPGGRREWGEGWRLLRFLLQPGFPLTRPVTAGLVYFIVAGLTASQGATPSDPAVSTAAIVFGQAAPLEGPAEALGHDMRQGLLAAFAEVNNSGGVKGRKLELITRDDGYEANRSIGAVKTLIEDDKVFALVGAVGTPTSKATLPLAAEAGIPFIGALTGAAFLRDPETTNVVNVRASYRQETEAMVAHLTKDLGITRIAVLYQDDAFGRDGLKGLLQALERRSLTLASEGTFERNTTAVKRALLQIRDSHPEAVILIGPYKPCAAFILLARQIRFEAFFVNISFVGSDALAKALGQSGAGVIITQVVPFPSDLSSPLIKRYQTALRAVDPAAPPGFVTLEGYLVGRLLIAALEKLPGDPGRKSLLEAVAGSSFDFEGFRLIFQPGDNQGSNEVYLTMIGADGAIRPISSMSEALQDRLTAQRAQEQLNSKVARP